MTRTVIRTMFIATGLLAAIATTHAQAPQGRPATTRLVRFAGVLTDGARGALTGPQTVTFTLFDQAEGGRALWTETLPVTADDRGRYVVALGASTPLPQDLFATEQARWIGTAIAGRDLGRTALIAVPYALKAADADTLGGHAAATYVRTREDGRLETSAGVLTGLAVDGAGVAGQIAKWSSSTTLSSSVISESASNRIGFGLTDPTGGGVVDSVFSIKNFDNNTGFGILNESQERRFAINTLADGGWWMYDGASGVWNPGVRQLGGNLAVGTSPQSNNKVHGYQTGAGLTGVRGSATTFNSVGVYGENSNAGGFAGFFSGSKSYIQQLGVGTTAPADTLQVAGDIRVGTGTTGCVKDADGSVIAGTCSSDARLKKNITPFGNTLTKLTQLQAVHFDWRAEEFPDRHFGAARSFGLVAQDVEAVLPELVVTDDQGFRAVKYSELPLYMLQAIKELKVENDAVKRENATLKEQLRAQDARAQQHEDRLRQLEALLRK